MKGEVDKGAHYKKSTHPEGKAPLLWEARQRIFAIPKALYSRNSRLYNIFPPMAHCLRRNISQNKFAPKNWAAIQKNQGPASRRGPILNATIIYSKGIPFFSQSSNIFWGQAEVCTSPT